MKRALGLMVALPEEARLILSAGGWRRVDGRAVLEADLDRDVPLLCVCTGAGHENALSGARWLARRGVGAMAVVGVSGALDPALRAGDLIVPDAVSEIDAGRLHPPLRTCLDVADSFCRVLPAQGIPIRQGLILSSRQPVFTPAQKVSLFHRTGAMAVDMESFAAARAADEENLSFFALRAVCDTAGQRVPDMLAAGLQPAGRGAMFSAMLRNPLAVPQAARIAAGFLRAVAVLRRSWRLQRKHGLLRRLVVER